MLGSAVTSVKDFARQVYRDVEGDEIPKEKMLIFEVADHTRIAVRASGTELKIKYYLFAQRRPAHGPFAPNELAEIKAELTQKLEALWAWLQTDAQQRGE